jgi:hypothetical protein
MVDFNLQGLWGNHRDFARAYLFECKIDGFSGNNHTYLVKSTGLPERNIAEIITDWQGMSYKIGGTSEFSDYTITFNLDKSDTIRSDFIDWMDKVHNPENNEHGSPTDYFKDITLKHLSPQNSPIITYKFIDAWPKTISEVSLDYSSKEVATFDMTFAYQYHKLE